MLTLKLEIVIYASLETGHAATSKVRNRDVAQSGSAPALGAGCRGFESLHPDHVPSTEGVNLLLQTLVVVKCSSVFTLDTSCAPIAQPDRATAF